MKRLVHLFSPDPWNQSMGSMTYTLSSFMVHLNCCQFFSKKKILYAKRTFSSLRGNCGNLYVIYYGFMMLQIVSKVRLLELLLSPRHSEGSENRPDCTRTVVTGVEKPCRVRDIMTSHCVFHVGEAQQWMSISLYVSMLQEQQNKILPRDLTPKYWEGMPDKNWSFGWKLTSWINSLLELTI